jgi:hypothetical protein
MSEPSASKGEFAYNAVLSLFLYRLYQLAGVGDCNDERTQALAWLAVLSIPAPFR